MKFDAVMIEYDGTDYICSGEIDVGAVEIMTIVPIWAYNMGTDKKRQEYITKCATELCDSHFSVDVWASIEQRILITLLDHYAADKAEGTR